MKNKIKLVNDLLVKKYGIPLRSKVPPKPIDLLIATILSQNTNDKNSFKAFQNLRNDYADWNSVANISTIKIEKLIKIAGLGKQKSKSIKQFLVTLRKEKGYISLDYLTNMDNGEVIKELTKYSGIGVKTASCVLLFSMRRNVCPVDTHVHRTTNRIGIVKTNSPDKTFTLLNKNLPNNIAHSFHTNLIRLGREICKSTKPKCLICPLVKVCQYEFKNLNSNSNYKENNFLLLDSIK
ncbi:MAG: endonuclease III [Bacteroidetes bacterium]|nr:endonuclease III [Bacteroidota bacterium]